MLVFRMKEDKTTHHIYLLLRNVTERHLKAVGKNWISVW